MNGGGRRDVLPAIAANQLMRPKPGAAAVTTWVIRPYLERIVPTRAASRTWS